jgi:hypothetical protein
MFTFFKACTPIAVTKPNQAFTAPASPTHLCVYAEKRAFLLVSHGLCR